MKALSHPFRIRSAATAFLAVLTASVALTGCGLEQRQRVTVPQLTSSQILDGSPVILPEIPSNPDYRCPNSTNVEPDYDWHLDGSGFFTVCQNRTKYSDILIHGQTHDSDTICVFPAEWVTESNVFTKPDLKTGGPWHQCIESTDVGVFASFPGVKYNAVFIVESQFKDDMFNCLLQKNYFFCPSYSFGRFR